MPNHGLRKQLAIERRRYRNTLATSVWFAGWIRFGAAVARSAGACSPVGEGSFRVDLHVIEWRCFGAVGKALDAQYVARAQC
jgi:hypothetical protein